MSDKYLIAVVILVIICLLYFQNLNTENGVEIMPGKKYSLTKESDVVELVPTENNTLTKERDVVELTTNPTKNYTKSTKYILYWTGMFKHKDFYLGLGSKIFENCTFKNCIATYNRSQLPIDEFDALAFHGVEYDIKKDKPKIRNPNQIYIFGNMESPVYTGNLINDVGFKNFYNWTMTYRVDSDIIHYYGFPVKKKTNYQLPSVDEIQKRPKKIAWFVSRCSSSSKRELLYKDLKKYINVDVYGKCGDFSCPRSGQCYEMLERDYKFYLSFENSICEDYVTEKLFYVLQKNIVPIVYGGANYSKLAPPHSVINVKDFNSIESLVGFIEFLDMNPKEYLKYFEWKKDYVINMNNEYVFCQICNKLNEEIKPKVYNDIRTWWQGENFNKCRNNIKRFF